MNRREILQSLATLFGGVSISNSSPRDASAISSPAAAPPAAPQAATQPKPVSPDLVSLPDFEQAAQARLSKMAFDYVAEGAADEITLRRNRDCLSAIRLKPRVLTDVSRLDTKLELFGQNLDFPILLAPAAFHKLMHPEGEMATARGASAAAATMVVSSLSTFSIEDIAKSAKASLWFQLYVQRDRGFTRELVQRAESAGCRALCITVDSPVPGTRNREMRDAFHLLPGMAPENLHGLQVQNQRQTEENLAAVEREIYNVLMDPKLTWDGIEVIRSYAKVPVILKGILNPDDARLALAHGVDAVLVSNHGGRQLDTVPATIEALPHIVESVAGRIPVLMDGGIRRGTDVLKALAVGARAVLIGRPYLWGLAVNGSDGVEQVIQILRREFLTAMALCGRPNLSSITGEIIWRDHSA